MAMSLDNKGYISICQSKGGEGGGGYVAPYTNNFFFDDFQLHMGLGCNCDVLELFQSAQNANAPHLRPFEGTPIYIGGGLIPRMAVLSGQPQMVFVQIGSSLTSNFQNLSGLLDQAIFSPKFIWVDGSGLNSS